MMLIINYYFYHSAFAIPGYLLLAFLKRGKDFDIPFNIIPNHMENLYNTINPISHQNVNLFMLEHRIGHDSQRDHFGI